jgi:vancomycin resistance protein YoaR
MKELGMAPVDASLTVDGQSILVTDDIGGFEISVDSLQADLVRELRGFTTPTINLTAKYTTASVRRTELQPGATALGNALENPLTLFTATDQWQVAPSELSRMLSLDSSTGVADLVVDEDAVDALVSKIASAIDQQATEAHLVESGAYSRIVKADDGNTVDQAALRHLIVEAIRSGQDEVEIPVATTHVDDDIRSLMTEYGITDLLATGSSDFSGSDLGRDTNVRLAAQLLDGILIAPGDAFSFNQALGSIADIEGFVPAGATEGGIPGSAVGGGVCQVSTSIFRAALQAGLPITEWWPHAFRSIYYEQGGWAPGFDASIQQPDDDPLSGPDLKFENTTDGWLLIRVTATSASELKVSLFGTNPGYSVVISDPVYQDVFPADNTPIEEIDETLNEGTVELWQPARDGVTMVVYRTVYAADGTVLIDESFVSTYRQQGPVYRVSPDMAGTAGQQQ